MTARPERLSLWLRLWHGLTALLFVILTATGIVLHFAKPGVAWLSYLVATKMHDWGGLLLAILYGLHLVFLFATGYWRNYVPARRGLWRRVRGQIVFYALGKPAVAPETTRFNALQQLVYLIVVFGLVPLLVVTGLLYLYYPTVMPDKLWGLAGLWPLALAHYALAVMGASYLVGHIYMATVGPKAGASLRLMITGRGEPASRRSPRRESVATEGKSGKEMHHGYPR